MKRRLSAILSRLSLLLFVAVCVLWVRSYFTEDTYAWYADSERRTHAYVASGNGGVMLHRSDALGVEMLQGYRSRSVSDWQRGGLLRFLLNEEPRRIGRSFLGFWKFHRPRTATQRQAQFWGLPYWALFILAAISPTITAMRRRRQRRRRAKGECPHCGWWREGAGGRREGKVGA